MSRIDGSDDTSHRKTRQQRLSSITLTITDMTLLVPIDFSKNSDAALNYAAHLARHLGAALKLFHVITPYVSKTTYLKIESDELIESALKELEVLKRKTHESFGIDCTVTVVAGDVAERILEASAESNVSMIVMGSNKKKYFLFGSITTSIVEKSCVPVMVLPLEMTFKSFTKIVFATDYQPHDLQDLQEVTRIARAFNCPLNVVHVVNRFEDDEEDVDLTLIDAFSRLIEKHVSYEKIKCEEYQYTDVPEGIQSYAEEEQADLLVVSTRQRKFIQRLFGRSVTRELLFDFNQPLLVYHAVEQAEPNTQPLRAMNYDLNFT